MEDYPIRLWTDAAPLADGSQPTDIPALSFHPSSTYTNNGAVVVICPGGGYRILAATHEGLHVAAALNQAGINAFVLRYRVGPKYHSTTSLLDGQRAIRYVRHHAERFNIDPTRIGMLGFSAGGHLTLAVGTANETAQSNEGDPVDSESSIPDFLIAVYPVSNGTVRGRKAEEYLPTDTQVNTNTPPSFLVHTHEDGVVPGNQSTLFYDALLRSSVPAELHIFGHGEHGVGLASGDPDVAEWFALLIRWLKRRCFLTDKTRVAINHQLNLSKLFDQEPAMCWATLIPDDSNAPIARTRISPDNQGMVAIPAEQGPVPGSHTLQLRVVSHTWPMDASGSIEDIDYEEPMLSESVSREFAVKVAPDGSLSEVQ